jgi:hypothetical protein
MPVEGAIFQSKVFIWMSHAKLQVCQLWQLCQIQPNQPDLMSESA